MVTRWYRPLEVVIGLKYDEKIDVFAAALIYLEMIHGKEIIQSETNMDQLHKLLSICGYPTQNSREYLTLKKLGVDHTHDPSKLEELTVKIS
jgi:serine/threonine protein kinase